MSLSIHCGVGFLQGPILLQFIIISNKAMSEYICIEIGLTFILICSLLHGFRIPKKGRK